MVRLAKLAGDRWPDPSELPDAAFFAVAATFTPDLNLTPVAKEAQKLWGLKTHRNQYGTSEVGPIGCEYNSHEGFTLHSDFHHVELVDPSTGRPVSEGQSGEVVITGLTHKRGFLPIRYATGDVASWIKKTVARDGTERNLMGPIIGRTDHQLKIFGQTVFPNLLLEIADGIEGVLRSVVTVVRSPLEGDIVTILCVLNDKSRGEELSKLVTTHCQNKLAVAPKVRIVENAYIDYLEAEILKNTNKSKIPRFFELPPELAKA